MGVVSGLWVGANIALADLPDSPEGDPRHSPAAVSASLASGVRLIAGEPLGVDGTGVQPGADSLVAEHGSRQPVASVNSFEVQVWVQIPKEAVVSLKLHGRPFVCRSILALWLLSHPLLPPYCIPPVRHLPGGHTL